jgi:cell division protein FtsB
MTSLPDDQADSFPAAAELRHERPLTRRQLLLAGLGGGAALVASTAASGAIMQRVTQEQAQAAAEAELSAAAAQLSATRAALETQIARLEWQLGLYQSLERIGLDKLIQGVLDTYDRLWPPVRARIAALKATLVTIEEALTTTEGRLTALRRRVGLIRSLLDGIEALIAAAQERVAVVTKTTAPLGEALGELCDWLLDHLPFGAGVTVRAALDRLRELVTAVPNLVSTTRADLLDPIQADWLDDTSEQGAHRRLFDPLRRRLLEPLATHLTQLETALSTWETDTATPLRTALTEREKVLEELARGGDGASEATL